MDDREFGPACPLKQLLEFLCREAFALDRILVDNDVPFAHVRQIDATVGGMSRRRRVRTIPGQDEAQKYPNDGAW